MSRLFREFHDLIIALVLLAALVLGAIGLRETVGDRGLSQWKPAASIPANLDRMIKAGKPLTAGECTKLFDVAMANYEDRAKKGHWYSYGSQDGLEKTAILALETAIHKGALRAEIDPRIDRLEKYVRGANQHFGTTDWISLEAVGQMRAKMKPRR